MDETIPEKPSLGAMLRDWTNVVRGHFDTSKPPIVTGPPKGSACARCWRALRVCLERAKDVSNQEVNAFKGART